jgi:hypothetical protein
MPPHERMKLGTGATGFVDVKIHSGPKFKDKHPKDKSLRPGDRVKIFSLQNGGEPTFEGTATLIQYDYRQDDSAGFEYWQVRFDQANDAQVPGNVCWRMVALRNKIDEEKN